MKKEYQKRVVKIFGYILAGQITAIVLSVFLDSVITICFFRWQLYYFLAYFLPCLITYILLRRLKTYEPHSVMFQLSSLGNGSHFCGFNKGWISIDGNENKFDVMWTSSKDTHNPLKGSAISGTFIFGEIKSVYKSALTMHAVSEERDIKHWSEFLVKKIDRAYFKSL